MKENKPCLLLLNDIHISKDNIPAFQANWQEAMGICPLKAMEPLLAMTPRFFTRKKKGTHGLIFHGPAEILKQQTGIMAFKPVDKRRAAGQRKILVIQGTAAEYSRIIPLGIPDANINLPCVQGISYDVHQGIQDFSQSEGLGIKKVCRRNN